MKRANLVRRWQAGVVLGLALVAGQAGSVNAEPAADRALPLGPGGLTETRASSAVAPGVTHTRIVRGEGSPTDVYVVDVAFRPTSSEARQLERRLRTDGFAARVERIRERAPDDPRVGPLGYLVRVGAFASLTQATEARDRLVARGYTGLRIVYSGEDGRRTTGPWVVNVLEVDPALFEGNLEPGLATRVVPGLEPLTALASQSEALAAVNGGYFVIGPSDGTPGDLAGISALGGALISEAVNGRTSLVLPPGDGTGADVAALSTRQVALSSDGSKELIDGLNRKPGLIRGCGGRGGDVPTEEPKHDFTCSDGSELILFTPSFGASTEPGEGTEAVLNANGTVLEVRTSRGGTIPPGGSVLAGTGRSGNWLRSHAQPGQAIGQLIAHALELPEVEQARTATACERYGRRTAGTGLDEGRGKIALDLRDLLTQGAARGPLVDFDAGKDDRRGRDVRQDVIHQLHQASSKRW